MIHEKYRAALFELKALAGDVRPELWERIRPIVQQLEGLEGPVAGLERCRLAALPATAATAAQAATDERLDLTLQ